MCKQFFESFASMNKDQINGLFANMNIIKVYLEHANEMYTEVSYVAIANPDAYTVYDRILNIYVIVPKDNFKLLLIALNKVAHTQIVVWDMSIAIEKTSIDATMAILNTNAADNAFFAKMFNQYANIACGMPVNNRFRNQFIINTCRSNKNYTYEQFCKDFNIFAKVIPENEFERIMMFIDRA